MDLDIVPVTVVEFYLGVTHCPPGTAHYATHLRNRGHDDWPEITVWPKAQHNRLTTGAEFMSLGVPDPVRLNESEKQMAIALGLSHEEMGVFLRSWSPDASGTGRHDGRTAARLERTKPRNLEDMSRALSSAGKSRPKWIDENGLPSK